MRVPISAPAAAVKKLNKSNATLREPPCREALFAESFRVRTINPVKTFRKLGFAFELCDG